MPATPNLALPYPSASDTADVPRDIKALADKLDLGPGGLVSALPGSPVDGQEINYLADATNGIIWRLRYRTASGSTRKWEFIGGSPLLTPPAGNVTTASASYVAFTGGPSLTVPLAGDYEIVIAANAVLQAALAFANMRVGLSVNGAAPAGPNVRQTVGAQFHGGSLAAAPVIVTLAAGAVLTLQARNDQAVSTTFTLGVIRAQPTRVG